MVTSTRLLLVEPDASDRQMIRRALRGRLPRFTLSSASDSHEVRARLSNGGYDIALVGLDGWRQPFEAFDLVRALAPDLPIVALSHTDVAVDVLRRGAASFALKTGPDLAHLH